MTKKDTTRVVSFLFALSVEEKRAITLPDDVGNQTGNAVQSTTVMYLLTVCHSLAFSKLSFLLCCPEQPGNYHRHHSRFSALSFASAP